MARRRSGKKIDFVHWTGFQELFAALAAGTSAVTAFAAQHDPETLLRLRGHLFACINGVQVPAGWVQFAIGMILVPEGTGSTVLWSPATDDDAPWIWYEIFTLRYQEMVTDVIDVPGGTAFRAVIDSKSMRIIRNQEVQLVIENVTIGTAMSVNVSVTGRGLFGT